LSDREHAISALPLEYDVKVPKVPTLYHVLEGYPLLLKKEGYPSLSDEIDLLRMAPLAINVLHLIGLERG
jgi:hypothetical protein